MIRVIILLSVKMKKAGQGIAIPLARKLIFTCHFFCFLDSFLTSRLVFFGCLATDGMDDRPVSQVSPRARTHAGTKLARELPVISDRTRPRPAGGKEEFANSTLRVRGRTRVRS